MANGTIRLYACGGCGANIASNYTNIEKSEGYAEIKSAFLDTSRSNLLPGIKEEDCFILPEVDGSGKIRAENHKEISASIKQILIKHPAESFNVVVFSGAGGSGSVIAPLIIRELLDRGESVVGIMVGSSESAITCRNTLNTLKSLDSISSSKEAPVVIAYEHNVPFAKRSEIDSRVYRIIASLSAICAGSGENHGLDSRDLSTWLNYHRACEVAPQVAMLHVCTTNEEMSNIAAPISIASLLHDQDAPLPNVGAEYSTHGYSLVETDTTIPDIHCIIDLDGLAEIHKHISLEKERYDELSQSRDNSRRSLISKSDQVTEDDLVL